MPSCPTTHENKPLNKRGMRVNFEILWLMATLDTPMKKKGRAEAR
jgi:hypothetical protein